MAAVIAAAIAVVALLRASVLRGRDSFYAAAAASCLVSLIVLAFIHVSLFGATLPVLAVIILGLELRNRRAAARLPPRPSGISACLIHAGRRRSRGPGAKRVCSAN